MRKFKLSLLSIVILAFFACSAMAVPSSVGSASSGKSGSRVVYLVELQNIVTPALGTGTYVTGNLAVTSANVNDFTGLTSPDVARVVTVKLGGTSASIAANGTTNVTLALENRNHPAVADSYWILGTDINGNWIVESLGFEENTAATKTTAFGADLVRL